MLASLVTFLSYVVPFIAALGLLIAVHEYGHYRIAVACGVKVIRFSVGFGKPLFRWKSRRPHPGQDTEFVIAAFPLGGYVKMLDEREAPVAAEERHRAFNTQRLRSRVAIVAAGPLANLLLAVLLYSLVNWIGMDEPQALLARPLVGSMTEQAGLVGGERVLRAGTDEQLDVVQSFTDLSMRVLRNAIDGRDLTLEVSGPLGQGVRTTVLPLSRVGGGQPDAELFRKIGVVGPLTRPEIGDVMPGGAAARAGLRSGDKVQRIGETAIIDGAQLWSTIRSSVALTPGQSGAPDAAQPQTRLWTVERDGQRLSLSVTPDVVAEGASKVGRIGAFVGSQPETVKVRYGVADGLWRAAVRTGDESVFTLRMFYKMVTGQVSLKNLSGPLSIAEYAGKSAQRGLAWFIAFLAVVSVSLGVLNLLPLPVLDGGHLMYYLWEGLTGKSVSDAWMERLQRGGIALLLVMMSIAFFNDVTRLFG